MSGFWKKVGAACVAGLLTVGAASSASAQIVIPDIGVDVAGTVTAFQTELGAGIAAVFLLFGAVLIVRAVYSWLRRSVRG